MTLPPAISIQNLVKRYAPSGSGEGKLALNQPEIAAVYCRKFEQATEADLESMREDLLLLEQLEQGESHDPGRPA